jgi:hypothetical protein
MGHGHSYTCNQKMNLGLALGHTFQKKKLQYLCRWFCAWFNIDNAPPLGGGGKNKTFLIECNTCKLKKNKSKQWTSPSSRKVCWQIEC